MNGLAKAKGVKTPLVEKLILKIRNPETNKREFRESVQKIGEFVALEISNHLQTQIAEVTTLLGEKASHTILKQDPILITILRAGVPFHYGMQRIFSQAESGFIGAMRNQQTLKPTLSYVAIPDVKGKVVIVADTMLATGGSFIEAIRQVKKHNPAKIIVAAVIAAEHGIRVIQQFDGDIDIFYACLDPKLNDKGYIVPGLGDAGDRSYGLKI